MFEFKTTILKRRRISRNAIFIGLIGLILLGIGAFQWLSLGFIPWFENLVLQIGLGQYMTAAYAALCALVVFMIWPAIATIRKKKIVQGGMLSFDEKNLRIIDGKDKYLIPESDLNRVEFELKPIEEVRANQKKKQIGGSYMKIPTKNGMYECEFHLEDPQKRKELLNLVEYLKIEHDVEVEIREKK